MGEYAMPYLMRYRKCLRFPTRIEYAPWQTNLAILEFCDIHSFVYFNPDYRFPCKRTYRGFQRVYPNAALFLYPLRQHPRNDSFAVMRIRTFLIRFRKSMDTMNATFQRIVL